MIIFSDTDNSNIKEMATTVVNRLVSEGNEPETVLEALEAGVTFLPLSDFDYDGECETVYELLEADQVVYVVQPIDDDDFIYVGTK